MPEEYTAATTEQFKVYFKTETTCKISFWDKIINSNIDLASVDSELSIRFTPIDASSKNISITSVIEFDIKAKRKQAFEQYNDQNPLNLRNPTGSLIAFLQDNSSRIESTTKAILESLQWRYQLDIDYKTLKDVIQWSFDGVTWYKVYDKAIQVHIGGVSCSPPTIAKNLIEDFIKLNIPKPFYHELIQTAESIISTNMFSATVLAGTALEVGIKSLLFTNYPIFEGIYHDSQLPPIKKLLQARGSRPSIISEHIPGFQINDSVVSDLDNFIFNRNKCVHQGILDLDWVKLMEYIYLIKDFLYYIDYRLGHAWAFDNISSVNNMKFTR